MFLFLKRLVSWWNGATLGTLLTVWRRAEFVYEDEHGNRYFEEKRESYDGRKRRWVTYPGYADASRIPPEWHGWMHHLYDERPNERPLVRYAFQQAYQPNLTGTKHAYYPKGSLNRPDSDIRPAPSYEAWSPDD